MLPRALQNRLMEDLQFEYLSDRPEAAPLVAGWYFAEWGDLKPDTTAERIRETLVASASSHEIPITVLAVLDGTVIGSAQLKHREMRIYPEKEHWLGGVFVVAKHRRKEIATRLIETVVETARTLGVKVLHIQTQRLDGGLYRRLGWRPVEKVHYNDLDVLVMQREL